MRVTRSCLIVLCALAPAALGTTVHADTPAPVAVGGGAAPGTGRYDFGDIKAAGGPPLAHTFLLRNDGATPLTLDRFQPSCHCTSAALVPASPLPVTLAPGAKAAVRVSVAVEPYTSGRLEKFVQIFTNGRAAPLATLTLDATLRPLLVMNPLELDFGAVPAGQSRSETLTATVDSHLAPGGVPPRLVASDPDIRITPLPAPPALGSGTYAFTYRVSVAPSAALGPVHDVLQFARAAGAPTVSGMTLADGPGVPVTGAVIGQASVIPTELAFGVVTEGHSARVAVTVTARKGQKLASARAVCDSRCVRLSWSRETPTTRVLGVTLSASAPSGSFQSQVTVTLPNGQHLRLPLTAYVAMP